MEQNLPEFQKKAKDKVLMFVTQVFGGENIVNLVQFDDGHFRITFKSSFFEMKEEQTEPSKSQWSTLKKRMKRRDHKVFIFKTYGTIDTHYYLDFGFFKFD